MTAKRVFLTCLGAELFPLLRLQPGRGMALTIMAALMVKHALYQYVPVPPPWAIVLHVSAFATCVYLVVGLFGFARIQALMIPRWDSGRRWLSFGASDQTTLLKIEPAVAYILLAIALLSVVPNLTGDTGHMSSWEALNRNRVQPAIATRGHVFLPFWYYVGLAPVNEWGEVITAYGRQVPRWFHEEALGWAFTLPFMACLGFILHGRQCDWPASAQYRDEQRQAQRDQHPGTLTFTTVEEIR